MVNLLPLLSWLDLSWTPVRWCLACWTAGFLSIKLIFEGYGICTCVASLYVTLSLFSNWQILIVYCILLRVYSYVRFVLTTSFPTITNYFIRRYIIISHLCMYVFRYAEGHFNSLTYNNMFNASCYMYIHILYVSMSEIAVFNQQDLCVSDILMIWYDIWLCLNYVYIMIPCFVMHTLNGWET